MRSALIVGDLQVGIVEKYAFAGAGGVARLAHGRALDAISSSIFTQAVRFASVVTAVAEPDPAIAPPQISSGCAFNSSPTWRYAS